MALALTDWLDRLQSQHPVEIDLGLERVAQVAGRLDLLRPAAKTFTVAGTNGKGSVVEVLSSLLAASGLTVGAYTSPHLLRFNERIRISGNEASDRDIVRAFEAIEDARRKVSLTYFEVATLAAMWLFREQGVDAQVLEVGLGGRLDAVNIVDADVAVVTSIGMDHTDWLGDDRGQIAIEKAGIARPARPCVVADLDPPDTLVRRLEELGAQSSLLGRDWSLTDSHFQGSSGKQLRLPHCSGLLPQNIGAAMEALERSGLVDLCQELIGSLESLGVTGRLSRHQHSTIDVIMDVAHNTESVKTLVDFLSKTPTAGATKAMFGVMGDKPIHDMISACAGVFDEWHLIDLSHIDRAMTTDQVTAALGGQQVVARGRFESMWRAIESQSSAGDRVVIFGSFFSVGEALALFDAEGAAGSGRH